MGLLTSDSQPFLNIKNMRKLLKLRSEPKKEGIVIALKNENCSIGLVLLSIKPKSHKTQVHWTNSITVVVNFGVHN